MATKLTWVTHIVSKTNNNAKVSIVCGWPQDQFEQLRPADKVSHTNKHTGSQEILWAAARLTLAGEFFRRVTVKQTKNSRFCGEVPDQLEQHTKHTKHHKQTTNQELSVSWSGSWTNFRN